MTVEPPPYQDGPRCDHGEPVALACPQCADPLTVDGGSCLRIVLLPSGNRGVCGAGASDRVHSPLLGGHEFLPLTVTPEEDRPMHALRRLWRLLTTPIRPRRPGRDRRETR